MNPRIHMAGRWWPLLKDQLDQMKVACQEDWELEVVEVLSDWWSDRDVVLSKTSGSTGVPKLITHQKKAMVESAERTIRWFDLPEKTAASLVMPARFIGGKMMLIRTIVGGWDLRVQRPSRLPSVQTPCDFVAMTVAQAAELIHESPDSWSQLSTVLLGGSPAEPRWIQEMPSGPLVYESFGMTETISHFAIRKLKPLQEEFFHCLEGFEVRSGADELLEVLFPDGNCLTTTDVVKVQSKTSFQWLGRKDAVINSGGIKIHPAQVEKEMAHLIHEPFRAYGEPHIIWGSQVVLRIHASKPPANALQLEQQLIAWARQHLPPNHAPKRIEWKALRQTDSGKWLRP